MQAEHGSLTNPQLSNPDPQMGVLQQLLGQGRTVRRFVTTPFVRDLGLMSEVQEQWVQHAGKSTGQLRDIYMPMADKGAARPIKAKVRVQGILNGQFSRIDTPAESVLYILGHSDKTVAEIGGKIGGSAATETEWWKPEQLVAWLTGGAERLPTDILAVKVWTCYSATNGFLEKFRRLMVAAGYRDTVFVGYRAITGAMFGKPVPGRPVYSKAAIADDEKTVLGRARDHRVVLNIPQRADPARPLPARPIVAPPAAARVLGPPPARPLPPVPVAADDDIDAAYAAFNTDDIEATLKALDDLELAATGLSKRLGEVQKK